MNQYDSIIHDLKHNMQEKPSAGLRDRIIKNAEQGVAPPPARRRLKPYPVILAVLIFILSATAVTAAAVTGLSWYERLRQVLQETRATDEGYVTYFHPLAFYFTEEMQEQQRRIAEMTLLPDSYTDYENIWGEQVTQHIVHALGLDLTRERDEIDAALKEAFSGGSVAAVRFDDTPLLLSFGFRLRYESEPDLWDEYADIQGLLSAGTHVIIMQGSEGLSYLPIPMDSDRAIRAWHFVEVLDGEHVGRTGFLPNFLLEPSERTAYDFDINRNLLEIIHPERGISFTMRKSLWNNPVVTDELISADGIAIIAADAIYSQFGFCIDGMGGYLTLVGDGTHRDDFTKWSVVIICEENTAHSMANELFLMTINPVTGMVSHLAMNTPETPFVG